MSTGERQDNPVTSEEPARVVNEPTVLTAVVPLALLILLIFGSLLIFGLDALDGPIQVALLLACMCAALVALRLGYRWSDVQEVGRVAMGTITSAIFILLTVAALIGTWNLSGRCGARGPNGALLAVRYLLHR
jgi:NhaC family Na+:H+ antiporter